MALPHETFHGLHNQLCWSIDHITPETNSCVQLGVEGEVSVSLVQARLEEELRLRDLETAGTKPELVERLHAALTALQVHSVLSYPKY